MTLVDELRLGSRLLLRQSAGQLAATRGDLLARLDHVPWKTDPYPIHRQLREQGPLTRSALGPWVASTHALCSEILRDRRWGTLGGRAAGGADPHAPTAATPRPPGTPPASGPRPERRHDPALDLSFLDRDPPDHTRLRRLVQPAFAPRVIDGYRPRIEHIAHRLLDGVRRRGPDHGFDLIADFAAPLPVAVICELLGIRGADSARFTAYGKAVGDALDGVRSLARARRLRSASDAIFRIFRELIAARRAEPGDDAVSLLVGGLDGGELTEDELLTTCRLLLIAGFETTVNLIGNAVLALQRDPEQWTLLTADPSRARAAADEALRYDAPVQITSRIAREDLEAGGYHVRRGATVMVLLGSAGRDPAAHDRPDSYDLTRHQRADHLAFSGGIHYCLGSRLARAEADIALRTLAERLPGLRLTGRPRRRGSTTLRGVLTLPVRA